MFFIFRIGDEPYKGQYSFSYFWYRELVNRPRLKNWYEVGYLCLEIGIRNGDLCQARVARY